MILQHSRRMPFRARFTSCLVSKREGIMAGVSPRPAHFQDERLGGVSHKFLCRAGSQLRGFLCSHGHLFPASFSHPALECSLFSRFIFSNLNYMYTWGWVVCMPAPCLQRTWDPLMMKSDSCALSLMGAWELCSSASAPTTKASLQLYYFF